MTAIFALLKQKDLMPKADIVPKLKISHKTSTALSNIPAPVLKNLPDLYMVDNDDDDAPMGESTRNFDCKDEDYVVEAEPPQLFSQSGLNDLVRDRSLSKESSELLASRLKEETSYFQEQGFPSIGLERASSCNISKIKETLCTAIISQVFLMKWE